MAIDPKQEEFNRSQAAKDIFELGKEVFARLTPSADACEHTFVGWRPFPDGSGGEQVCSKCGMGAMAYSLRVGP